MDIIQKLLAKSDHITASDVAKAYRISRQAAHKKLAQLVTAGTLIRTGATKSSRYTLSTKVQTAAVSFRATFARVGLTEESVVQRILHDPRLPTLTPAARRILTYALSEMINNAIEHSASPRIAIECVRAGKYLTCRIRDTGLGVFRTVQRHYRLPHEQAAIQDILKGKRTTAPATHSGEGIFFTSKAVDIFKLSSHGWELIVDNTIPDVFVRQTRTLRGTLVECTLDPKTTRNLEEIFRAYTDDEFAFSKTEIKIKLFKLDIDYLSRSQARRILDGLEHFKKIVLDCADIDTVGQAFCDEIWRVWHGKHPNSEIIATNTAPGVAFMIRRAGGEISQ